MPLKMGLIHRSIPNTAKKQLVSDRLLSLINYLIFFLPIDQYAKRTVKSIKDWFTLIPNEDNMKKSAVR